MDLGDFIAALALVIAGGSFWVAFLAYRKSVFQKAWTSKVTNEGALGTFVLTNRTNEVAVDVDVQWAFGERIRFGEIAVNEAVTIPAAYSLENHSKPEQHFEVKWNRLKRFGRLSYRPVEPRPTLPRVLADVYAFYRRREGKSVHIRMRD